MPAAGLDIWSDPVGLPPAAVLTPTRRSSGSSARRSAVIQELTPRRASPLAQVQGGWEGPTGGGDLASIATEYDGAWEVAGGDATPPRRSGGPRRCRSPGDAAAIRYGAQLPRTIAAWLLAAVWAAALWITRKPVAR